MAGPTQEQIEHYVRTLDQLFHLPVCPGESLSWTVVRPHRAGLTVRDLVRRLHGDPDALTTRRPDDDGDYDFVDAVFLEDRGDVLVIVAFGTAAAEVEALRQLSRDATVHSVFWLINNHNRLYRLVDSVLITELDVLDPLTRWGADPDALTDHLGALCDLAAQTTPGPDWETAMATLESLTGQRLDAEWFARPQLYAEANRVKTHGR